MRQAVSQWRKRMLSLPPRRMTIPAACTITSSPHKSQQPLISPAWAISPARQTSTWSSGILPLLESFRETYILLRMHANVRPLLPSACHGTCLTRHTHLCRKFTRIEIHTLEQDGLQVRTVHSPVHLSVVAPAQHSSALYRNTVQHH